MANRQHLEWFKEGADAWNERRKNAPFTPDLSDVDFLSELVERENTQNYRPLSFSEARMLAEFDLKGIDLSNADLSRSNFSRMILSESNFNNSNLAGANFSAAMLSYASFFEADLNSTNFDCALMMGCDLRGARFRKTYVRGAYLRKADVSSLPGSDGEVRATDIRGMKALYPNQFNDLEKDANTLVHKRFENAPEELLVDTEDTIQESLSAPVVRASSFDFDIDDKGVTARLPDAHVVRRTDLGFACLSRTDALVVNAKSIAESVSNKLGEDTRRDLQSYADHLTAVDPPNPHRLSFLAKGIAADLEDPLVSAGYSPRLEAQLRDFLEQHQMFLVECIPAAAEAIATKDAIELDRAVTKEEATEVLDSLEGAILQAEAATDSYLEAIKGLRDHDDELGRFKLKAFSLADQDKLDQLVKRETVELAAFGSRLYWRAKEVMARVRLHAGDIAIVASTTGKTAPQMAQAIIEYLQPVMVKLQTLISVLPPV